MSSVLESATGGSGNECEVSTINIDRAAGFLVTDPASKGARVIVRRVWFDPGISSPAWAEDPDAAQVGSEIWLDGQIRGPRFEGNRVVFTCRGDAESRAKLPRFRSADVMHSHTPPAPGSKIGWLRLETIQQ